MGLADGISNMGESHATSKVNFKIGLKMFKQQCSEFVVV
jgi:hypothetical protein